MSSSAQCLCRLRTGLTGFFLAILLGGCSIVQPGPEQFAKSSGFERKQLAGQPFAHIVFEALERGDSSQRLHIYIGGDGIPWERGRFPASDPTPRRALAMELMARDKAASVYLGRPCYFGLAESVQCNFELWTSRRYSREVIDSMGAVIRAYQQQYRPTEIVLIGYSGGGTLATLLAPQIPGNRHILTVAANLDIDMWTRQFGHLPLQGSLNPVDLVDDLRPISQFHLMGGRDSTVPNNVTASYTDKLQPGNSRLYPNFDHSCCWGDIWESILGEFP
jgi:dienelactone hydrolase